MNKVIEIENLVKNYQVGTETIHALRSVSLSIQKNEYVAIMGPSGSGKSTLMNILGCLDTPTDGEYILNNMLALRAGYNSLFTGDDSEVGPAFGAGLNYVLANQTELNLDFAYQDFGVLENVRKFTLGISF